MRVTQSIRPVRRGFWVAILTVLGSMTASAPLSAVELYVLNTSRSQTQMLRIVDQETGASEAIPSSDELAGGSWSALTSVPGLLNHVYALHNPPSALGSSQTSRLVKIRTTDGTVVESFPLFDTDVLDVGAVFGTGIAVSPLRPDVAIVSGFELFGPKFLFEVDLATGAALGPKVSLENDERLESLTYSLDGQVLYGADTDGRINIVDTENGEIDLLFDPDLTDFITGMAFHPDTGDFYIIDGFNRDRLHVTESLTSPDFVQLGHMGIIGPEGLAFVSIPEPTTLGILLLLAAGYLGSSRDLRRRAIG